MQLGTTGAAKKGERQPAWRYPLLHNGEGENEKPHFIKYYCRTNGHCKGVVSKLDICNRISVTILNLPKRGREGTAGT
jgi:hypothetical protein